jgi:hypothetical protein
MNTEIKLEEYKYLLREHKMNRKYIFERPLLIAGIVAVAAQYLIGHEIVQGHYLFTSLMQLVMFPVLICILYFNLAFISERIRSDARVVAFIQLFHEGELVPYWIGWETSLRYYRMWKNSNSIEEIEKNLDMSAVFHHGWFYPKIYNFHIWFIVILLSTACIEIYDIDKRLFIFAILVSFYIISSFYFAKHFRKNSKYRQILQKLYCFLPQFHHLHSSTHENLLEVEKKVWRDVFDKYIICTFDV